MCYARIDRSVIDGAARLKAIVKLRRGHRRDRPRRRARALGSRSSTCRPTPRTVAEGAFALLMALFKRFKPIQHAMQHEGWIWPEPRWLGATSRARRSGWWAWGASAAAWRAWRRRFGCACSPSTRTFRGRRSGRRGALRAVGGAARGERRGVDPLRAQRADPAPDRRHAARVHAARRAARERVARRDRRRGGAAAGARRRAAGRAALDVYGREPLSRQGHPLSALYGMDNVLVWPHLTFYTREAMQRLEDETLARCFEALSGSR